MPVKKAVALLVSLALLILFILFIFQPNAPSVDANAEGGTLQVFIFGIGRADAILITTENHALMIDTGENQHGEYLVDRLTELGVERLDYLIITHFDSDHVGGAHTIINNVETGKVVLPDYSRETRHVERLNAAMINAGISPYVLTSPLRFTLDDAEFLIDPSGLAYFSSIDESSIIVSISHGTNRFLFTGDALNERLDEILENEAIMACEYTLVKMPRHGRYTPGAAELIRAARPRYAVITGFHPDDIDIYYPERPADERILEALEAVGAQVFFTMDEGLHIVSSYSSSSRLELSLSRFHRSSAFFASISAISTMGSLSISGRYFLNTFIII